jgi:two-component system, LytTR family, response regulator
MIHASIIDDESLARELIRDYASEITNLEIIGEFEDGFSGFKGIQELKPDLVFLDIQMPKLNGFEMIELLDEKPQIIFTTAFDQYAIKAFEMNAIDYLLKPFSLDRFKESVEKATSRYDSGKTFSKDLVELKDHLENKEEVINRIVVKSRNSIFVLPVHQVNYIEAQDDYVMVYTDNAHYLKQKTMKYYEDHLDRKEFLRVHRSYIVRLEKIIKIEPYEKSSYIAVLKNNEKIPVSRSGYSKLRDIFNS